MIKVEVPVNVLSDATMTIVREYYGDDTGVNDIATDAYVSCQALAEDILVAVMPAIQAEALERAAAALEARVAEIRADQAYWGGPDMTNGNVLVPELEKQIAALRAMKEKT